MLIFKCYCIFNKFYATLHCHHIHMALTDISLSLKGKYSEDFTMNVFKYIVFLESTHVCIFISYGMPIISLICRNWSKILKFPVPVHVVFTLYMLIRMLKFSSKYKNVYMIS